MKRIKVHDKYFKLYMSNQQIEESIQNVADKLNNDLKDSFNYPNSQFDFEGRCALLKETHFSITSNN